MDRKLSYEDLNKQLEDACHQFEELVQKEADTRLEMNNKLTEVSNEIRGIRNHIDNIKSELFKEINKRTEGKKSKILKSKLKELKDKYIVIIPDTGNNYKEVQFFKVNKYHAFLGDNYFPATTTPTYEGRLIVFEISGHREESKVTYNFKAHLGFSFSKDYIVLPTKVAENYMEKFQKAVNKNYSAFEKELNSLIKISEKYTKLNLGEPDPLPESYHYQDYRGDWFI